MSLTRVLGLHKSERVSRHKPEIPRFSPAVPAPFLSLSYYIYDAAVFFVSRCTKFADENYLCRNVSFRAGAGLRVPHTYVYAQSAKSSRGVPPLLSARNSNSSLSSFSAAQMWKGSREMLSFMYMLLPLVGVG